MEAFRSGLEAFRSGREAFRSGQEAFRHGREAFRRAPGASATDFSTGSRGKWGVQTGAIGARTVAETFALLERASGHPEQIAEPVRLPATEALKDRRVLDDLEYMRLLGQETSQLDASPVLRDSKAAARAKGALERERKALLRVAGARVVARLRDTTELLGTLLKEVDGAIAEGGPPAVPAAP